jgi:mevalonate kinase
MTLGTAPGKIILTGEHAVVYHRPAIAAPVRSVEAKAYLKTSEKGSNGQIWISAPQIKENRWLREIPQGDPLREAIQLLKNHLIPEDHPPLHLSLESSIPISGGMGSSAALATSILRAMAGYQNLDLTIEEQIELAFAAEILFHGTPSGIDNTVVVLNQLVFFQRDQSPIPIHLSKPFHLLIADSGQISQTATAVGNVQDLWHRKPELCEDLFDSIAEISHNAKASLERGDLQTLGVCFDENQEKLERLRVSSPKLDELILTARKAGALGAKLSGGGMGGNLIALVDPTSAGVVRQALEDKGATQVIHTEVA